MKGLAPGVAVLLGLTGCGAAPRQVVALVSIAAVPSRVVALPGPETTAAPLPSPAAATPSSIPSVLATTPAASMPPAVQVVHTFAWWDHPQGFNTRAETAYTLPTSRRRARSCQLGDVELPPRIGLDAGHYGLIVMVRNVSLSACELRGAPSVALIDAAGVVRQSGSATLTDVPLTTVVLLPNS